MTNKMYMKSISQTKLSQSSPSRNLLLVLVIFLFSGQSLFSQVDFGVTLGGGYGKISHQFIQSGNRISFSYPAPALYVSGEMGIKRLYLDMSLAVLLASSNPTLGNSKVDLTGYKSNYGMDFTLGIGYLFPLAKKLEAGGEFGFHVSSFTITPSDPNDINKLRFGGYYGIVGVGAEPRIRYTMNKKIKLSLNFPVGFDFIHMSEDVVVGGQTYGKSPAIVQPASLVPQFKGLSFGAYLSVGYFFGE
jgi:hypothetical protein